MDDSWHFCLKSQLSYHKSCIYWSLSTTNIRNCLQKCGFRRADLLFQLFQFPYLHLGIDLRKYELNKCFEAPSLTCGHLFSFKPCLIYFNRGNFLLAFNTGVSMPILWFSKKGDKVLTPVGNKEFTRKALVAPQSEHRHTPPPPPSTTYLYFPRARRRCQTPQTNRLLRQTHRPSQSRSTFEQRKQHRSFLWIPPSANFDFLSFNLMAACALIL